MENIEIYNEDCITGSSRIADSSVDLIVTDPPFGISESKFDKHYKRDSSNVISGYKEAPSNYKEWTLQWMSQAYRILKPNGSMFVIIGTTNLLHVLNAGDQLGLTLINHLIWKYNFGVNTTKKFVTSHYHIIYFAKNRNKRTFNTYCRFSRKDRTEDNKSSLYKDLEDVFIINKEFCAGQIKNQNKLPEELIQKLIQYASNENDIVVDFFLGNFTTAYMSLRLGRKIKGFELNKKSYDFHIHKVKDIEFGKDLKTLRIPDPGIPRNAGKSISKTEKKNIRKEYKNLIASGLKIKDAYLHLQEKFGRGKFSIINILREDNDKN